VKISMSALQCYLGEHHGLKTWHSQDRNVYGCVGSG
jgi:hypothetical protein